MATAARDIVVKVDAEIADMVPRFLENRARDVGRLREAIASGDRLAVRKIGHTMLGAGGGYGFPLISEIGARIEDMALEGSAEAIASAIDELAGYLARVRVEVA